MNQGLSTSKSTEDLAAIASRPEAAAYIKKVEEDDAHYFAVYSCDGQPLAIAANRELAFIITRQQDLVPVDVH